MEGQGGEYHNGCHCPNSGQKEHDEMRKAEVDIGGKEHSEKKLMRPQTEDPEM